MYRGHSYMFQQSIRNKLIVLLLIITILPFGSSIIITYIYTKESLKDQTIQENINLIYQGKVNLESYIKELNGLTLSIYNHPQFLNYMRTSDKEEDYITMGYVKSILQTLLYAEENIQKVYIHFAEGNKSVSVSKRSTVVFSRNVVNVNYEYYEKARKSSYNMHIEPMHYQLFNDSFGNPKIPKKVFSLHRAIINVPSSQLLGYISLDILPEKIFELGQNLYNSDTEEFYIVTPQGELIYGSNNIMVNDKEKADWINVLVNKDEGNGTFEIRNKSFEGVIIYEKMSDLTGGWILVKRIPYTTLFQSVFHVTKINIIIGVIGLLLVVLATLFVSVRITSPIRVLLKNIEQVEEGNMEVRFASLGKDEIGILGDRFKQMIEKINHLINREYKLELENKTNQLKVLQSQINPHFLYNALQSIGTIALKNKVPQIYTLITHLSKIMRYGMNMEEDMVPLEKEINYTKAYLLLQKERFSDQLEYTLNLEDDVMNMNVPKMILQPIIENYFKHGFDIRDGVGRIDMTFKQKESFLNIQISDNGSGVSESRLEEIRQLLDGRRKGVGEENIGLRNVYARLKLYFGERATLKLQNNENGGLLVTMSFPIMEGGTE